MHTNIFKIVKRNYVFQLFLDSPFKDFYFFFNNVFIFIKCTLVFNCSKNI